MLMTPKSSARRDLVFNISMLTLYSFLGRNKAQDALWFGETYGLIPQSLMLQDRNGMAHEINLTQTGKLTLPFSILHANN